MTDTPRSARRPPERSPDAGWLPELVEILELRRPTVAATAVGFAVLGVLVALVAPSVLPASPVVGAAVGLAAGLLALAVAVGVDSVDAQIRGPRHVRSLDANVLATIEPATVAEDVDEAAGRALARTLGGTPRRIGVAPVARSLGGGPEWAAAMARSLARRGRRVVIIDVASPPDGTPGATEVASQELKLTDAVTFDDELMLARLGPGQDPILATETVPSLLATLPRDIDVVVLALPSLAERGALSAAEAADALVVLVEEGASRRVDLLATLDAMDTTGVFTDVLLLAPGVQPPATPPLEARLDAPAPEPEPQPGPEPQVEVEGERVEAASVEAASVEGAGKNEDEIIVVDKPDDHDHPGDPTHEMPPVEAGEVRDDDAALRVAAAIATLTQRIEGDHGEPDDRDMPG